VTVDIMLAKTCTACGITKSLDGFSAQASQPDGHMTICKECRAAYNRAWYAANKARQLRLVAKWKAEHRDVVNARNRASYQRCKARKQGA
jgi:hypothetical protein